MKNFIKMACTAAEIAEKKRKAIERLKQTKASVPTTTSTTNSKNSTSHGTDNKKTLNFYGNASNEKATALNEYEHKMKQQPTYHQHNRISSQPYPRIANATSKTTNNNEPKLASVFVNVVTCTCSMISPKRFQVIQKGYHIKLVDIFKTIPTKSYGMHLKFLLLYAFEHFCFFNFIKWNVHGSFSDPDKRIWSFDLSAYDEVQKKVGELSPQVVIGQLPKFVLKLLKDGKYCIHVK